MKKFEIITKDGIREMELTPLKAIRQKCLECSVWSIFEVKTCQIKDCALWNYRLGKNPARKGQGNPNPTFLKREQRLENKN